MRYVIDPLSLNINEICGFSAEGSLVNFILTPALLPPNSSSRGCINWKVIFPSGSKVWTETCLTRHCQPFEASVNQLSGGSFSHIVSEWVNQSVNQPTSQPTGQLTSHSVNQTPTESVIQLVNQPLSYCCLQLFTTMFRTNSALFQLTLFQFQLPLFRCSSRRSTVLAHIVPLFQPTFHCSSSHCSFVLA